MPEETLVELETLWVLPLNLPNTLEKLVEDRTCLLQVLLRCKLVLHRREERLGTTGVRIPGWCNEKLLGREMSTAIEELVAERNPVFLDEDLKAVHRPVVGVETELRERRKLGGAVPAIRAVDENVRRVHVHIPHDE